MVVMPGISMKYTVVVVVQVIPVKHGGSHHSFTTLGHKSCPFSVN